jgi:hypothetical protein
VKRRLIVRVDAEAELVEAADWYERRRPGLVESPVSMSLL